VAQELVRRVVRDQKVDLDATGLEPEEWWEREGFGELSYSNLIEGLASTELARRALLRGFFEPGPENSIQPTAAHRSLARLLFLPMVCPWHAHGQHAKQFGRRSRRPWSPFWTSRKEAQLAMTERASAATPTALPRIRHDLYRKLPQID
jgi:hypothetical protein